MSATPSKTSTVASAVALRTTAEAIVSPLILPALLLCDFSHLSQEIENLEQAGARALHLDVMDGHFVPNLTYGPTIVEAVCRSATVPVEVHLMIERPEDTLALYQRAGASVITVHIETLSDPRSMLNQIRSLGLSAHLALNPKTDVLAVFDVLDACDGVLVMSVEPGFGGQAFLPGTLHKLRAFVEERNRRQLKFRLAVDGGIDQKTIGLTSHAGAQWFVAGSSVIRSDTYAAAISSLERLAADAISIHS